MQHDDWVYLNGRVLPMSEATIGIEDRGFQFADGVYEVIRLYGGRPFTLAEHLDRLERSAAGISLRVPLGREELARRIVQLVARTGVGDGMIYLQLTRGNAPRNHPFPAAGSAEPTLLFYTRALPPPAEPGRGPGAKLITVPDERWKRCWVKSIALLPNVLAKNAAVEAGADEAVFVEDGIVTECCASNLFAVIDGALVTHPVGSRVLPGVTRLVLQQLTAEAGIDFVERPLTHAEAIGAAEVLITSTTRELHWVASWDGQTVGRGTCGPVTRKLHAAYQERVSRDIAADVMPRIAVAV